VTGTLHFVITESDYPPPPGSYNTPLNHGMRDFFPDVNGEVLSFLPSQTVSRTETYTLGPGWVEENLECIVFVQNDTSKEIYQTARIHFFLDEPELVASDLTIDDSVGGDGNGRIDPGETADLIFTLMNLNPVDATGVSGTLATNDAHAMVTDGSAGWPDIAGLGSGNNDLDRFSVSIDPSTPFGYVVPFTLDLSSNLDYSKQLELALGIGSPHHPIGPDAFGYFAYEDQDDPSNVPRPAFNWVEIDPGLGGPGTLVQLGDDQTVQRTLPFDFRLYGNTDNRISISSNGFLALGTTFESAVSNGRIPGPLGPPKMIAGFWTDLNPVAAGGGKVYEWFDATNDLYIVEFSGVEHYHSAGLGPPETFQFILYDPARYPTQTGDGQIDIQYFLVSDPSGCTVGIENETETVGTQYLASSDLNAAAYGLEAGLVIRFTTTPPAGITGVGDHGSAPAGLRLAVSPNPFRSGTSIVYSVPQAGPVTLQVFRPDGGLVRTLLDSEIGAGPGTVRWDGRDSRGVELPAGIYLYRLSGVGFRSSGKVIRLR
jgi:hypothetical protein